VRMAEGKGGAGQEQEEDSFVRLAMRNMVQQAPKAVYHFGLTFLALLVFFVGLGLLTK